MILKKATKKAKRRFLLFGTLSISILIFLVASISGYWMQIYKKSIEHQFLVEQINELKAKEILLKTEIQKLQDPDYVARYARERYLFSKDGEILIKIP